MAPPTSLLVLPKKVLFVIVSWLKFPIAPPLCAEPPENVLSVIVSVPVALFLMAPPTLPALLSKKRLFVMVNAPSFQMPPPSPAEP